MGLPPTFISVALALGTGILAQTLNASSNIQSVEFVGMKSPGTAEKKADIYTDAQILITDEDGKTRTHGLKYHQLMATTKEINGKVVGGLYDAKGQPLEDLDGHIASDAPDGTSLIDVWGGGERDGDPVHDDLQDNPTLALVTQYEYKELPPNDGKTYTKGFWGKLPALMSLAKVEQNKKTGALKVLTYDPISFSEVNGGWIHCGSTMSAWNTHIGSEEYEPDAKTREGLPKAGDSDDGTDIDSFSQYYFGNSSTANPYHYGLVPEVRVNKGGEITVVKHYAPGRFAREMQEMASDNRTAIGGDDGKFTGLFMFVADKETDLSAGTIYAAKVTQDSDDDGGSYSLQWIKLGHASDAEIKAMVDGGIKFSDIFDVANSDPSDSRYTRVVTYTGTEWLRLKPGMEKAAAFLETRRYAALMGATTELSKMEYIAFNKKDRKFYIVISRVDKGMADGQGDIHVAQNDGGMILEMSTAKHQKDNDGNPIESDFVGTTLVSVPELVGGWLGKDAEGHDIRDAEGNRCEQDKVCGPDNLRYVDSIRTLFIGEDTGRRNNNYVWAFNVDTRKLSRILSVPMNAEATGLTIAPNYNDHAYVMSNFQHPGEDDIGSYTGGDKDAVLEAINKKWDNKKKASIGYIGTEDGALPALD